MKVALTVWDERISPVFDVCREALILLVEDGKELSRSRVSIDTVNAILKNKLLIEMGVETLICGAISAHLKRDLIARGVNVIGFVAGEIDEVIDAVLSGTIPTLGLSMPGCGRQHRFRGGRYHSIARGRRRLRKGRDLP